MKITKSITENDAVLLEVEGEVDAYTSRKLEQALDASLVQSYRRLVLDLTQTTFISSSGLQVILFAHRDAVQLDGEVRLFGLNAHIRRTFEIAGYFELMRISETRQEAMEGW